MNANERMRRGALLALGALVTCAGIMPASADGQAIEWLTPSAGLGEAGDWAHAVDASGAVYVAGRADGALPGHSITDSQGFLRKYDSSGAELWTVQFDGDPIPNTQGFFAIPNAVVADDLSVCVGGRVWGALPGHTNSGDYDAFVRMYDADGSELWTIQFGASTPDAVNAIAMDAGAVYVAVASGHNRNESSVRKLNRNDGSEVWADAWTGASPYREFLCIAVGDGAVYAGGDSLINGTAMGLLRKYDAASGAITWSRDFGNVGMYEFCIVHALAVHSSGVYVGGRSFRSLAPALWSNVGPFVRKYDFAGSAQWTHQFGSYGYDYVSAVAVDGSGVYAASNSGGAAYLQKYGFGGPPTKWSIGFGTGSTAAFSVAADAGALYVSGSTRGALPGQTSSGGIDAFVRKYTSAGAEVWTRQFGSRAAQSTYAQAMDDDGAIYIGGRVSGALPGQLSAGGWDAFVAKYDRAGAELWTRQFGTSGEDVGSGVAVDASGVFVVGSTAGALTGAVSQGGYDAFARKYDFDGNLIWTRQFGSSSRDVANGVSASGGVYNAGYTEGALQGQSAAGYGDAFLLKFDDAGTLLWTRQFGTSTTDEGLGISADVSGVYVCGYAFGALPGQSSAGAFLRKYDALGTSVWTRQFTASRPISVAAGAAGVFVVGMAYGALPGQPGFGAGDAYVRRYDASGAALWTRQFGTSAWDEAHAVAVDDGGVSVVGSTTGALPGQVKLGTNPLESDAFVRRYDLNGSELWTQQFGDTMSDAANGVASDASGVYVSGSIQLPLTGTHMAFLAKLVNTETGLDVTVNAGSGVGLTFDEVTAPGMTSVTTGSSGPPPPDGFRLGTPPTYYDLTTSVSFAGSIRVCIDYTGVSYSNPASLRLFHFEGGVWNDVTDTGYPDLANEVICGTVSSLSPFALFELDNLPPTIDCPAPVTLWSPEHDLVDVSTAFSASDPDGDPVSLTIRVFSDETEVPETGDGTGRHAPDFKNELYPGGRGVLVRSERRNPENGRVYLAVVTADDGRGGITTAVCVAAVCPHDQNQASLAAVLAEAAARQQAIAGAVSSGDPLPPPGLYEHGLSGPLGPKQ